jgi:hypothetical protein
MQERQMSDSTMTLLRSLGVEFTPSSDVTIDFTKAESAYIHHSSVPVAVTAFALVSPAFARGRFPKTRLVDLVAKRPVMDGRELTALARICGIDDIDVDNMAMAGTLVHAFTDHLHAVIYRRGLDHLFGRDPKRPACNNIDVRPRGLIWGTDKIDPPAMAAWRRAYKALATKDTSVVPAGDARQMMAATVMWLYRGGPDKTWLHRVTCGWHAADAITTLKKAGMLRDWAKLVALYPGW